MATYFQYIHSAKTRLILVLPCNHYMLITPEAIMVFCEPNAKMMSPQKDR